MTKKVRIENADTSDYQLVVETWQLDPNGGDPVLLDSVELRNPCDIADALICSDRQITIRERNQEEA